MTSIVKVFNNQLYNFVNTLSERFPENKEIKLGLTGIETLKSYNPKKSIEYFILYGYKYRQYIMAKDSVGLKKLNLDDELAKLKTSDEALSALAHLKKKVNTAEYEGIDIMQLIIGYWDSLANDEQENIWKYLQVLITLSDKYIAENLPKV